MLIAKKDMSLGVSGEEVSSWQGTSQSRTRTGVLSLLFLRVTSIKTGSSAAYEVFDVDRVKVTSRLGSTAPGYRLAAVSTREDTTNRTYKAMETFFLDEINVTPEALELVPRPMAADLVRRCIATKSS